MKSLSACSGAAALPHPCCLLYAPHPSQLAPAARPRRLHLARQSHSRAGRISHAALAVNARAACDLATPSYNSLWLGVRDARTVYVLGLDNGVWLDIESGCTDMCGPDEASV